MTRNENIQPKNGAPGFMRQRVRKNAALAIHAVALAVLLGTLGQPFAIEKPAGVRRAVETVAKSARDGTEFLAARRYVRFAV